MSFKTIISRKKYLSDILRTYPVDYCLEGDCREKILNFYKTYYKPPPNCKKYEPHEIVEIRIGANVFNPCFAPSKCFVFTFKTSQTSEKHVCISKKFLDGSSTKKMHH